jgi:hypothetical protein
MIDSLNNYKKDSRGNGGFIYRYSTSMPKAHAQSTGAENGVTQISAQQDMIVSVWFRRFNYGVVKTTRECSERIKFSMLSDDNVQAQIPPCASCSQMRNDRFTPIVQKKMKRMVGRVYNVWVFIFRISDKSTETLSTYFKINNDQ